MEIDSRHWRPLTAVAALAVLLGPIRAYIVPPAMDALARHELLAEAIASFAAGLLLLAASPKQPRTSAWQQGRAICLLLLPQLLATILRSHLLPFVPQHDLPWAAAAALTLAAPLWLAFLASAQLISIEVPRVIAGAAIAAAATVLLTVETSAYTVSPNQIPALFLALALAVLTVYTWAYAAPRLSREAAAPSAATFLLLRAAMDTLFSLIIERTSLHDVVWRDALELLCLYAALTAAAMFLWFWLLKHLPVSAFALHPIAVWTASIFGGVVVFGFANWRADSAALINLAALWFGLRARVSDEQPVALELS